MGRFGDALPGTAVAPGEVLAGTGVAGGVGPELVLESDPATVAGDGRRDVAGYLAGLPVGLFK